jgi:chemotaxis protein CheX
MSTQSAVSTPSAPISSRLIMPFMNSARDVFSTMVGVPTTIGKPHLKNQPAPTFDVSGIVGFSGDILGTVVVSFQSACAVALVKAFSGSEFSLTDPDFSDGIGELANMIAGAAKKEFEMNCSITVPTVIIGSGHSVARISGVACVVIPISTPVGEFAVEVSIKPAK